MLEIFCNQSLAQQALNVRRRLMERIDERRDRAYNRWYFRRDSESNIEANRWIAFQRWAKRWLGL
jgi:hypothetical protein